MSEAIIRWVGGPVLHAHVTQGEFRLGEAIEVGTLRRPGEVIRLKGDEFVGQGRVSNRKHDAARGHEGAGPEDERSVLD